MCKLGAHNQFSQYWSNNSIWSKRMKGQAKIIEKLNARLGDELKAINQYIVHAENVLELGL